MKWFLDNTLEIALAYLRGMALLLPAAALAALIAAIWAGRSEDMWRLVLTALLLLFIGGGAASIGFWFYGNEDWRPKRGKADG